MKRNQKTSAVALAVCAAALLSGCDSTSSAPSTAVPAVVAPRPLGVQDPAVIPKSASDASCTDPTASLRPPATLPAPGHMPGGSTMAKIVGRGILRVGVDQTTYLFGYRDPSSGKIVGFDIDMAHAVAKALFGDPDKIQLVAITTAERIPYLQQGKVDMVVDTMTINCARREQVAFSTVYYNAGQTVLLPTSSKAKSIDDFGGQKVCAAAGSTSIAAIAAAPGHPIPVAVSDWTDCLVLLQQHQIAAISTDDTILRGLAAQDPDTRLLPGTFTSEPYGIAMAHNATDLVRFVNGVLAEIRGNGEWASTYRHWLGSPVPAAPAARYSD